MILLQKRGVEIWVILLVKGCGRFLVDLFIPHAFNVAHRASCQFDCTCRLKCRMSHEMQLYQFQRDSILR